MPSWKDVADRYDKEQADKRQREADERAIRERQHAMRLEEVAKVEPLVQDFLRAAKSVRNRGGRDVSSESSIFRRVKFWSTAATGKDESLFVQTDGLWRYGSYFGGWDQHDPRGFEIGRNTKGLYCKYASGDLAAAADAMQRQLIKIMRENRIPLPS